MATPLGPLPGVGSTLATQATQPTQPTQAGPSAAGSPAGGSGFGGALADALGKLGQSVSDSSQQAQSLAAGTADNLTSVVMSTEQATIELQLASQLRDHAVSAYQEIFGMQV